MPFVHLRTHTEFSVVDGTLRVDDAAALAREDGQVALAITDLNNLFGAVKFYTACRKLGVKPIIGADVLMEPEPGDKQATRLLLLVQNTQGYLNLSELLARGWTQTMPRLNVLAYTRADAVFVGALAVSLLSVRVLAA